MNNRAPLASLFSLLIAASLSAASPAQDRTGAPEPVGPPVPPAMAREPDVQISEYVREVFQDRRGDLWFGTNGDGVCRHDGESLTYFNVEQGFGGRAVRGIVQEGDDVLWFATDGGVSRYEADVFTNYTTADGLLDDSVWSLALDSSGAIWAGTHRGVCRFDGEAFVPFPLPRIEVENPTSRFTPNVVFAIFEDPVGNLWFGTDGEGAHRYDGESFTSFTAKDGLAGNQIRAIEGDRHGRIWLGTNGAGVSCYDGAVFRNFTQEDGLNNDRVYEILEDRAGNLWFSTLGAGACRYDGTAFTAFGEEQGLANPHPRADPGNIHVQEFFEDRDGVLWLGCSGGLFRLDGESFVNVTRNGPWPARAQPPTPAEASGPMASFARMVAGEWRLRLQSGHTLVDTWSWGPSQRSMLVRTEGFGAAGEPWRGVRVFYWHPGREQVCLLGLSPFRRGVSEGTMSFEGETADAVFDLYQTSSHREMGLRWTFAGRDRFRETLLEATGPAGLAPLNELEFVRSSTLTATGPRVADGGMKPSQHLRVLEPLLGHTWDAEGHTATGGAFRVRTTVEWVPYADYAYARTVAATPDGASTHLLDAILYHHTGTGALRCLALSAWGGVHEGGVSVLADGALQLDLKTTEGDRVVSHVVRFDFEEGGALRDRVWSVEGNGRTLLLDVHHTKLQSGGD